MLRSGWRQLLCHNWSLYQQQLYAVSCWPEPGAVASASRLGYTNATSAQLGSFLRPHFALYLCRSMPASRALCLTQRPQATRCDC
jgi:hypothetical protein